MNMSTRVRVPKIQCINLVNILGRYYQYPENNPASPYNRMRAHAHFFAEDSFYFSNSRIDISINSVNVSVHVVILLRIGFLIFLLV